MKSTDNILRLRYRLAAKNESAKSPRKSLFSVPLYGIKSTCLSVSLTLEKSLIDLPFSRCEFAYRFALLSFPPPPLCQLLIAPWCCQTTSHMLSPPLTEQHVQYNNMQPNKHVFTKPEKGTPFSSLLTGFRFFFVWYDWYTILNTKRDKLFTKQYSVFRKQKKESKVFSAWPWLEVKKINLFG